MDTVRDLCKAVLQEIGVVGIGQPMPADYAVVVLERLQLLRDEWIADRIPLFTQQRLPPFALVASQQDYTIGLVAADFTADRPEYIAHVAIIRPGQTMEETVVPYRDRDEWYAEPSKDLTDQAPTRYLYEPSYPLGTFTFWPTPLLTSTVRIAVPVPLVSLASLDTPLAFPPGYQSAWLYNLAMRCCRPFRKAITADLDRDATLTKGIVARNNWPGPGILQSDGALLGDGEFDIVTNRRK